MDIIKRLFMFTGIIALNISSVTGGENDNSFQRRWKHVSENSAVIYWQLDNINKAATSYVEYGTTKNLGLLTSETKNPRWGHMHRLKGLTPGKTCYYRMVIVEEGRKVESELLQLTPERTEGVIYIPGDFQGNPPYILDKDNAHYVLTGDLVADGTAIQVEGKNITLDLNGHSIIFGNNSPDQVFGVEINSESKCIVANGTIVQGEFSGEYSAAIRSYKNNHGTEICGISTDVHLRNAYPMMFRHGQLTVHHNDIYSRVTELKSRHYPGNALLVVYGKGENIHIHDNLLSEGCHRGISVSGPTGAKINHNDIRHHQQYVNGYAIAPGSGADVHHNKITSTGRGVHLTGEGTEFHDNYIDIKGHQHLSDLPAKTRPFHHRLVELHGIKFEGKNSKNCKIYNNYVRIIQPQPVDSDGQGHPADKMENGVYFRSKASLLEKGKLVDLNQSWKKDRWRYYYVKYHPEKPAVQITGNDSTTLYGDFEANNAAEYTVFMKWMYVPPTPLNLACYNPNGMNEIFGNTFIGITTYREPRHGGYGDTGQWATAIMFVGMDKGPAENGKYTAYIHNNRFFSNDLFLNSHSAINMDIKIENNIFEVMDKPFEIYRENRIRNVGKAFEKLLRESDNSYKK